jgi:hypothetical protein
VLGRTLKAQALLNFKTLLTARLTPDSRQVLDNSR